jgi:hypothetical protein
MSESAGFNKQAIHCLQHAQHARSALRRSAGWMLAWPSELVEQQAKNGDDLDGLDWP